ncbi:MAG TPA: extracellular solute-binding protein [Spirochaetales bacterium]|nr:extracellular solute-binding protein [Spirochaetales bacterium]HRY56096.1 extracellular solute-binding protein [Spirochaetia bacterium]HRZ63358.1 extracellular solute-binding protein [Spirochaetia bacterium]
MRTKAILCAIVAFAACFAAFGAGKDTVINYYTDGSDNVRVVWEAVIDAFNKKNTGVVVKLQFLASGAGGQTGTDKLIAAIKAKQKSVDIDLLELEENKITRILTEGAPNGLAKLDWKKIPNIASVSGRSLVAPDQAMPYRGSAVFIAYNSAKVPTPPATSKDLYAWIKANPGRFAYNDPATGGAGGAFVQTAIYNFLPAEAMRSVDEKWVAQWDQGFNLLKEIHPFLYKASGKVQYTVKNQGSLDLLASGSIDMCPAWADQVLDQKAKGLLPASIRLAQIDPPLTGSLYMLGVPSLSKNKEAAYKFLNFVASAEAQDIFVRVMKAIPVIDPAKLPADTVSMLSGLKANYRTMTIGNLGSKQMYPRWTREISTLP